MGEIILGIPYVKLNPNLDDNFNVKQLSCGHIKYLREHWSTKKKIPAVMLPLNKTIETVGAKQNILVSSY